MTQGSFFFCVWFGPFSPLLLTVAYAFSPSINWFIGFVFALAGRCLINYRTLDHIESQMLHSFIHAISFLENEHVHVLQEKWLSPCCYFLSLFLSFRFLIGRIPFDWNRWSFEKFSPHVFLNNEKAQTLSEKRREMISRHFFPPFKKQPLQMNRNWPLGNLPVCRKRWFFRFVCLEKPREQMWHLKGHEPLWTYMCDLRSPGVGNDLEQRLHLWGLSCWINREKERFVKKFIR